MGDGVSTWVLLRHSPVRLHWNVSQKTLGIPGTSCGFCASLGGEQGHCAITSVPSADAGVSAVPGPF